jgi:hypothetical protein
VSRVIQFVSLATNRILVSHEEIDTWHVNGIWHVGWNELFLLRVQLTGVFNIFLFVNA